MYSQDSNTIWNCPIGVSSLLSSPEACIHRGEWFKNIPGPQRDIWCAVVVESGWLFYIFDIVLMDVFSSGTSQAAQSSMPFAMDILGTRSPACWSEVCHVLTRRRSSKMAFWFLHAFEDTVYVGSTLLPSNRLKMDFFILVMTGILHGGVPRIYGCFQK